MRAAAISALLCAVSTPAYAEEEVRILLSSDKSVIAVGGKQLAVYDGETGDRLASRATEVAARKGIVEVRDRGVVVARAKKVIVEAKGGVSVARGVYLGRIELAVSGSSLVAINRLPLETYLLGIVGSEMNPDWPIEALKAQAIAARTYAMQRHMMMRAANKSYDLESTVISQVYKGAERIRPSVIRAVKETRGEVLAHSHGLVEALFHSTCGGKTVSAKAGFGREVSYLSPRSCKWCRASTRYAWTLAMPVGQIAARLSAAGLLRSGGRVEEIERSDGAVLVTVRDAKKRTKVERVSARAMREAVGYTTLFSDRFTAETNGKKVVEIRGHGFGHGVGMCQWGARGMALEGRSYREILAHYYFGAEVKRIY